MRAFVVKQRPDKRREKIVVTDWKEPAAPIGNEVLCQAVLHRTYQRYRTKSADWR